MAPNSDKLMLHCSYSFLFSYYSSSISETAASSRRQQHSQPPANPAPSLPSPSTVEQHARDSIPDTREASLSLTTREMQHIARLRHRHRLEQLQHRETSKCLQPSSKGRLERAARMDRQSLEALEAATARIGKLHPLETKSADGQQPAPAQLQPAPRLGLRAGRQYEGTSPFETPSTPTGTDFNIHSIPSKLPSDPTETHSELFRADRRKLLSPSKTSMHAKTFELRRPSLHEDQCDLKPSDALVHEWFANGNAAIMKKGTTEGFVSRQSLFEKVVELASGRIRASVASEALASIGDLTDQGFGDYALEGQLDGYALREDVGGHSFDSWSEESLDRRLASEGIATESKALSSVEEEATGCYGNDDCEWLDLGAADGLT